MSLRFGTCLAMHVLTHPCWFHLILFSWKGLQAGAWKLHVSGGKKKITTEKPLFWPAFGSWEGCRKHWKSSLSPLLPIITYESIIYLEQKRADTKGSLWSPVPQNKAARCWRWASLRGWPCVGCPPRLPSAGPWKEVAPASSVSVTPRNDWHVQVSGAWLRVPGGFAQTPEKPCTRDLHTVPPPCPRETFLPLIPLPLDNILTSISLVF